MHLLIAGIPATGKSTFARWLVEQHGYHRCPSGEEPGSDFLSEVIATRSAWPDVVIDWGFPVGWLPHVRNWIADGVEPWWFDGDRDAARQIFLSRSDHPATPADWDRQLAAINDHWADIQGVFRGRVMVVIEPGPTLMSNEDRFHRINDLL
jgi:hypothetical protein